MTKNKVNQNTDKKTTKKTWTPQENDSLLSAVHNKGNSTLADVFANISKQTGRPVGSISQHYYTIAKKNPEPKVEKTNAKKNNNKDMSMQRDKASLIQKIDVMPPRALKSLNYLVGCMNLQ